MMQFTIPIVWMMLSLFKLVDCQYQYEMDDDGAHDNVQDIYTNAELLTVYDPRNPMTKRRRDESSMLLHQKKT
ncbi:unnamed protein product [Rotaria sp. Silwood1]|nr:unnamed protein product [Rotaria sp. Silwood1]